MPRLCPLADPTSTETVSVRVLARGTQSLWVHTDAIPWLVTYLADEVSLGGVGVDAEEDNSAVADGGVEGLRVEWDFHGADLWTGTFVRGPLKGESYVVRVSSLSEQKWAIAKASCSDNSYGETFQDANEEQKRDAARCFLVLHCSHLLAQTAVAAAPALESPAPEAAVAAAPALESPAQEAAVALAPALESPAPEAAVAAAAVAEPEAAAAAAANAAVADVALMDSDSN